MAIGATTGTVVHVIFTGIVSLIPQDGSYLVRLQDASMAHEPHFASLLAEEPNVIARASPEVTAHQVVGPKLAAWRIPNGTIRVENRILDDVLAHDLGNVLEIADACPGDRCGVAKRSYDGVELYIDRGTLTATALESHPWRWKSESADRSRFIAEEICWTFRISGRTLKLSLPDGKGGATSLHLKAPKDGGDIELRLQNVPKIDFIPTIGAGIPDEDHHAAMYFLQSVWPPEFAPPLIAGPRQPIPRQHPNHRLTGHEIARRVRLSTSLEKSIRVNCPPALWQGVEGE